MSVFNYPLKAVLSAAICVPALCISAETFAASVSSPQTATATVTFSAPSNFTHTLTAVEGLEAGVVPALLLARGKVAFSDAPSNKVALTFGSSSAKDGPIFIRGTSQGVNNPDNKIVYFLGTADGSTNGWSSHDADSLIPYAYVTTRVNNSNVEYSVQLTVDQRVVSADSYIISVDAYAYTS